MEQLSTIWQGQNFNNSCVNGYEALDIFAEAKEAISFEMLNYSCEKAIQFSIYEQWNRESLSMYNNTNEELNMLTSFYMPAVLTGIREAGFKINTSNINSFNADESLAYSLKNGLFKDNASGVILECANFKIIPKKNNNQESLDNFLPAIWKFKCINNKAFTMLTKKSIVESLNSTYAELQALMAASKISHALFSCMDEKTHDIKHIWVEFDAMYYINMMNRIEKIIANTKQGLWHMPLAKDVIKLCSSCTFKEHCKKKCN